MKNLSGWLTFFAVAMFAAAAVVITKGYYIWGAAMLGVGVFVNSIAGTMRRQRRYEREAAEREKEKQNAKPQQQRHHKKRKK